MREAMSAQPIPAGRWVSSDGALVDRRVFSSREIYDRELETVFAKSWLFLGHDSMVPKSGDYITTTMGETPVIVGRAGDGKIYVNINSCRHRGLRVCRSDSGNAPAFVCPYHGLTYGIKGELRGWPQGWPTMGGWNPVADKSKGGLIPVRCESYKGLIFGNFDDRAIPLIEYIGDLGFYIDGLIDRSNLGIEFLPGVQKRRVKCNWKFPTENLCGDRQHGIHSHRSVFKLVPDREEWFFKRLSEKETGYQLAVKGGHGSVCTYFPTSDLMSEELMPSLAVEGVSAAGLAKLRELQPEALERLGEAKYRTKPNAMGMFPTLTWLPFSCSITVAHPKGPTTSELWSYVYVDRAWPVEVQQLVRQLYYTGFGPSGCLEQDDIENWEEQTSISQPAAMARYPFNYLGGLEEGFGKQHPVLPGLISSPYTDAPQRLFYCHWQDMVKSHDAT
jgi:phenylpropionate dioxygenase-like ring-hydroxylating dioxygenase large terminal subunit